MPIAETIISTLAPFDCLVCQQEGELLCAACRGVAIISKRPTCFRCNKISENGKTCAICRNHTKLAGITVASHYDGVIKTLIYRIKFDHARAAAITAARLITPLLRSADYDIVTAIPAAPQRLRERGFNQAQLIAKAVARELGLPYADLLLRTKAQHQVGLSRAERLEQIQGAFMIKSDKLTRGARILIIDDVITTGATMSEAAKILREAGAKRIWGAAVAKH